MLAPLGGRLGVAHHALHQGLGQGLLGRGVEGLELDGQGHVVAPVLFVDAQHRAEQREANKER